MSLTNYRDVSRRSTDTNAGFQFEFNCGCCSQSWKSPFKPYRGGQFAGLVYRFGRFLGDRGGMSRASDVLADFGAKRAGANALQEAIELAETRYIECPGCSAPVCEECWNPRATLCARCAGTGSHSPNAAKAANAANADQPVSTRADGGSGLTCPNCSSQVNGGRFCAECGFDMASTHKSCPGCGTLSARAARFCPDCGHGF